MEPEMTKENLKVIENYLRIKVRVIWLSSWLNIDGWINNYNIINCEMLLPKSNISDFAKVIVARMVRIELTLRNQNGILSPARLPIPPHLAQCSKIRVVVRDRIELSTQGFSILCSTDWAIEPYVTLKSGGERRIRTFEAVGGGFTVRRIWPLSNLNHNNNT